VAVIDGMTGDTTLVPADSAPGAAAVNPVTDKIYVGNYYSDDVTVIDGTTNQVLKTIAVGQYPVALCHNPVQDRVYVANYNGSSVSVLRDSGGGIEESFKPQAASPKPAPTVVRGVLVLGAVDSRQQTEYRADLLDASGRKVLDLRPGPNDVRGLAPGVYFVREEPQAASLKPQAVRKVVVTR
jgi:YVTN family beta-propeller protein